MLTLCQSLKTERFLTTIKTSQEATKEKGIGMRIGNCSALGVIRHDYSTRYAH